MTLKDLIDANIFEVINQGENLEREISKIFCCDLLSIAMSKLPENAAWVTVMGNVNTLAVSTLTDTPCIILAERAALDLPAMEKAKSEKVTVFSTSLPIFEAALLVYERINASTQL